MGIRAILCALCFGTLLFSSWVAPFPMDDADEDFWSKTDFEAAADRSDQQLEPFEDEMGREEITAQSGYREDYEDYAVHPNMLIKTNYEEEGNTSQILTTSQLSSRQREHLALEFFRKFQYYNGNEMVEKQQIIRKMQRNYGLPVTGELDDDTVTMMISPRCGNPDTPQNYNYFPGRPQWTKSTVTYKITGYSPDISPCNTRNIIRKAFRLWSEVVELDFVETEEKTVDIEIYFGYGWHRDAYGFDNKDGVLAHAFPPGRHPIAGDAHFDEMELWTLGKGQIRDTYLGNSKGAPCVFPFTYKGKVYNSCVSEEKRRKGRPWCATTSNYHADKKFGFCPSPLLFTYGGNGKGRRCKFPFTYKGKEYTSCTTDGMQSRYQWCSITSNYDKNKKWGFCPGTIEPSQGVGRSLLIVAAHEFGHAIGLEHSSSYSALMYPSYKYSNPLKLSDDDIEGARSLYGSRKSKLPQLKLEKCGYKNFN